MIQVPLMSKEAKKEVTPLLFRYVVPDEYSQEEKEAYPIPAEEIITAIKDGKAIEIINAVIEGSFILKSINIEREIAIQRTKIKGPVDWSYAAFKQILDLKGSIFEADVILTGASSEKDIFLDGAIFFGNADFLNLTAGGGLCGNSTKFRKGAIFYGATFKKMVQFNKSVFEKGMAFFGRTHIGGSAEFANAIFKQKASFNSAKLDGGAFFNQSAFEGEADFINAQIGSVAVFTNAIFEQKASFNTAKIDGIAFFNPATFKQKASFNTAKIDGGAFFNQSAFEDEADFISAQIGSAAVFTNAIFKQKASFNSAKIDGVAFFNPATFEGEANFGSAQIGRNAEFTGTVFNSKAIFYANEFKRDTVFYETVFARDVDFQNSSFRTIFFGAEKAQFSGKVDLRGCTYDRIEPVSFWQVLLDKERLDPYDRQPFTQMEERFRQAGEDSLASDVYYERKIREAARIKIVEQPLSWIGNRFLWLLTGYGVKLWRLFLAFILILLLGPFIFHLDGAVKLKQEKQPTQQIESQRTPDEGYSIAWAEAFWVNIHLFLPVEIPSGSHLEPSTKYIFGVETRWGEIGMKFITFATMLKLAGWVLVPVALAGLSGLLKR